MLNKILAGMCTLGFAATSAAQLQVYTPDFDLRLPTVWSTDWLGTGPNPPTEFFDIRIAPDQQLSTDTDGTLILTGTPGLNSSQFGETHLSRARNDAPDHVTLLAKDTESQTRYLAELNLPLMFTVAVSFEPGDSVGPTSTEAPSLLIATKLYTEPEAENYAPINVIDDGFTMGVAIQENDGIHYGWITLERANPQNLPGDVYEQFRVVRYAYELTAGVPALVSAPPCLADTNGDGQVTPADFSAWVAAFNTNAPECDQNNDGMCTPADFSAWVANYNAGC